MAASSPSKKKTAKSGNPAVRSTAKTWKRAKGEDLELPSGNVALVKRPGPAAIMSQGILPDELTPIVQEAVRKGKGLPPEKTAELISDPKSVAKMLEGIDKMMAIVVLEPKVAFHKREILGANEAPTGEWEIIPEDERDDDTYIYTDEVDIEDKMFIFNFAVGGTRDLTRFRSELASGVGDVPSGEAGEDQPE